LMNDLSHLFNEFSVVQSEFQRYLQGFDKGRTGTSPGGHTPTEGQPFGDGCHSRPPGDGTTSSGGSSRPGDGSSGSGNTRPGTGSGDGTRPGTGSSGDGTTRLGDTSTGHGDSTPLPVGDGKTPRSAEEAIAGAKLPPIPG